MLKLFALKNIQGGNSQNFSRQIRKIFVILDAFTKQLSIENY
jgi:hypothetical protein